VHIYPATKKREQFNILIQGKDCRNWIVNDFQRLQQVVVRLFIQQLSRARVMEAWHDIEPTLTLPPPIGCDVSREENLAALTFHDLTDDESSAPQRPPLRHPVKRDTGLADTRPSEIRQTSKTERSTSLSHTEKLTPVL
jgi:hypothetical protein